MITAYIVFSIAISSSSFRPNTINSTIISIAIIKTELGSCRNAFPNIQIEENITNNLHIIIDIILIHSQ